MPTLEAKLRATLGEWFDVVGAAIRDAARVVAERAARQSAPDASAIERELSEAKAEQKRLVKLAIATGGEVDEVAEALKAGRDRVRPLEAALVRATAPREDAAAAVEARLYGLTGATKRTAAVTSSTDGVEMSSTDEVDPS